MGSKKADIAYQKGQTLGHYHIIDILDQGKDLYLAQHAHNNSQVIIEVLRPPLLSDLVASFRTQTQTLMKLQHPHILRLRDAGIDNHYPFLVTDYLSYVRLREHYPEGKTNTLEKVLPNLKQVAAALQYVHEQNMLHGALCLENILLDKNHQILLWGFAIEVISQNREQFGYHKGGNTYSSIAYTAPERIQGSPCSASDQYSLAVVVYELLSGSLPFTGSYIEVANQQIHTPPPPLRQKAPHVSSKVESIVMKALAKSPEQRFADVLSFVNALDQERQVLPRVATARRTPPAQPTGVMPAPQVNAQAAMPPAISANSAPASQPPVQTPPMASPSAPSAWPPAISANSAPAGKPPVQTPPMASPSAPSAWPPAVSANSAPAGKPPVQTPPMASPSAWPPAAQPPSAVSLNAPVPATPELIESPPAPRRRDGNTVTRRAFAVGLVGLAAVGGAVGSYVLLNRVNPPILSPIQPNETPPANTTPAPKQGLVFTGHLASVNAVSWSPDGKLLASAGDDSYVQVFEASTGKRKTIYSEHKKEVATVAWSPDSKSIASAGQDGTVQLWNVADGKPIITYKGHSNRVNAVAWSSDSRLIASGGEDKIVRVWSVIGGITIFNFPGHTAGVLCVGWQPDNKSIASGSWDGTLRDWATVQHGEQFNVGEQIFSYGGHGKNAVYALSWSPDGKFVASAGADQAVLISRADDGLPNNPEPFKRKELNSSVRAISWSSKGDFIVSGYANGEVVVWRVTGREPIFTYDGHKGAVNAVAWSPDGQFIASAGSDKTVHIWQPK